MTNTDLTNKIIMQKDDYNDEDADDNDDGGKASDEEYLDDSGFKGKTTKKLIRITAMTVIYKVTWIVSMMTISKRKRFW